MLETENLGDQELAKFLSAHIVQMEQDIMGYIHSNGTIQRTFNMHGRLMSCILQGTIAKTALQL